MTERLFRVLVVCSGNLCRSPLAAQLLRARTAGSGVEIESAGTVGRPGMAVPDEVVELSRRYGGDPSGHEVRRLTRELIQGAGLVLAAAREHRAAVVEQYPRAAAYTFTITQFARLLGAAPPIGEVRTGADLVALAAAQRGYVRAASPADDDIPDPYRRSFAEYELSARMIDRAVDVIAPALSKVL